MTKLMALARNPICVLLASIGRFFYGSGADVVELHAWSAHSLKRAVPPTVHILT